MLSQEFFYHKNRGEFVKALRCVPLDIAARSLSHLCRYNGATSQFYSVAQHCVILSNIWPNEDPRAKWGLLHDLHECILGDITRPVARKIFWKKGKETVETGEIENLLLAEISKRFNLPSIHKDVIEYDLRIVADEMKLFFPQVYLTNLDLRKIEPLNIVIEPVSPNTAMRMYLDKAIELKLDSVFLDNK